LQNRRTQQEAVWPSVQLPPSRHLAELSVLADPLDVGVERIAQTIQALVETRQIVEKHEVEATQCLRHCLLINAPVDDGRKALVLRLRKGNFLQSHVGRYGVRTEHEYNRVGLAEQCLDTLPPILKRVDFGAVDQGLE